MEEGECLLNDEIDVARAILRNSPVLKNADLIMIVKKRSQDHLKTVASRDEVGAAVADALVEHGDDQVLVALAGNHGAVLSPGAAASIVARSETVTELHEPLVPRADLPADLFQQLLSWVSDQLRDRILAQSHELDAAVIDGILEDVRSLIASEQPQNVIISAETTGAEKFIRHKIITKQLDVPLLVALKRDGRAAEFLEGFARLMELEKDTAQKILSDPTQQALAIACKASDLKSEDFSALVLAVGCEDQKVPGDIGEIVAMYAQIPRDLAQRTMRFGRVRQATSASA